MTKPKNDIDPVDETRQKLINELSPAARSRAERIARLNSSYVKTRRDDHLREELDILVENANASLFGASSDVRLLMVMGPSGSGKTTLINKHLRERPEFQSDPEAKRLLSFVAPRKASPKALLKRGLQTLGMPVVRMMHEDDMTDLFTDTAAEQVVRFTYVDELQHATRGNGIQTIMTVQDTFKMLVDNKKWPIHTIVSGMPVLERFREGDNQVRRRSKIIKLDTLGPGSDAVIAKIMKQVVETDAGLAADPEIYEPEFVRRVIHAAADQFGRSIEIMREACVRAFYRDSPVLGLTHFAAAYQALSGCGQDDNVFLVADWSRIPTSTEDFNFDTPKKRKGKK